MWCFLLLQRAVCFCILIYVSITLCHFLNLDMLKGMSQHRYSREEKGKAIAGSSKWIWNPPILFPDGEDEALIEEHKFSLIGRVFHPTTQNPAAVISFFPKIWRLSGKVEGKVLGRERLQFRFQSEGDLNSVLRRAPFHYNRWMLVIHRWEPSTAVSFPS